MLVEFTLANVLHSAHAALQRSLFEKLERKPSVGRQLSAKRRLRAEMEVNSTRCAPPNSRRALSG